jgi:glycosyltransferase involved in cell wall biosynthesis
MGQPMPLVSIIVPAYNVAEYLWECVESIRQQSYILHWQEYWLQQYVKANKKGEL